MKSICYVMSKRKLVDHNGILHTLEKLYCSLLTRDDIQDVIHGGQGEAGCKTVYTPYDLYLFFKNIYFPIKNVENYIQNSKCSPQVVRLLTTVLFYVLPIYKFITFLP